ncbi:hypothetical protein COCCADRAFT_103458 [Bipolaris zeicola 26-R-13]|uniref:Uncharacterized protein n=1 Tax=Cochliobolus carbonum (strain 26-R-13) TaxID=930089 RepID=W6XZ81_COCC2|nr:uncharacterized protein COCCADRAFT_103458 [Bipolaris zeicola 26-R-13]EUC30620.1 hypothetical protein COCCADRAFT_103458 [Bipolaris zeicola 26-R-13]
MVASHQLNSIVHAATGGSPHRDNHGATSSRPNGLGGPSLNGAPRPFSRQCDTDVVCVGTWVSNTGSQHTDSFPDNGTSPSPNFYALMQGGLLAYAIAVCMKPVSSLRHVLEWLSLWRGLIQMF